MAIINIHDAKTHFSKLVNQVLQGEEIIIARGGKPLIRLLPYTDKKSSTRRKGGKLRGMMSISEDFHSPLPTLLLQQFYKANDE